MCSTNINEIYRQPRGKAFRQQQRNLQQEWIAFPIDNQQFKFQFVFRSESYYNKSLSSLDDPTSFPSVECGNKRNLLLPLIRKSVVELKGEGEWNLTRRRFKDKARIKGEAQKAFETGKNTSDSFDTSHGSSSVSGRRKRRSVKFLLLFATQLIELVVAASVRHEEKTVSREPSLISLSVASITTTVVTINPQRLRSKFSFNVIIFATAVAPTQGIPKRLRLRRFFGKEFLRAARVPLNSFSCFADKPERQPNG